MSINEHPPEVRRRHTQMSGNLSLFSRLTGRSDRRHGTTERTGPQYEYYPCYDLSWATLKKFLEEKWPNKKFPDDGEKTRDQWVFEVPEMLTEKDRNDIAALRDTAFSRRLHDAADDLCESNIGKVEVCIRDLKANDGAGRDVAKRNVHKPDDLTTWLGIRRLDQVDDTQCHLLGVAEKDPKCRLIYIYGDNTRVMPGFLDFLLTFGLQSDQRGISFSVTKKSADKEDSINSEFSIRPAVFYHSFDVVGGNSVWIIAKGGTDIYQRFKELTGQDARPEDRSFGSPKECFRSSLSTHLMLCHWSTEDWKGYLKWLEYVVDEQTKRAVLAPTNDGYHYTVYTAADIQRFLSWQERISEVITVLESNVESARMILRSSTIN
ncbi:hypothetical protein CGMCC3_g15915 [Colletotrichum fructicola]|nr:uncharacterized protein CGMCC3_g15915 [Colletotrichum fructicola]KAE9567982.1 hypothetical protein CGMCC3_g15915 [Colletotrichum fructicola]